ncbi:hypothetical protein AWB77_02628 [Caballeronia fortuita]|uniref:Uncharacterized protein n=1 Tax=Caballeronia fortuita TaxID=1777138 RepID=A0A158BBV7_9BURK|nr:hypothetical protein [Caballeronia fortuita]SAK67552.1 hypothetical protein AWB77_02628 [Caballeronia fortuita]
MQAENVGFTPAMYGYGGQMYNPGGVSMIAADGTLSLASVSEAVKRVLQGQAQQINQLQQAGAQEGQGGQGGQGGGGVGSATMLSMQAKVGEYTASLQQGTSMMSSLAETHKSVAQNTK